jgi:hypothetical protein
MNGVGGLEATKKTGYLKPTLVCVVPISADFLKLEKTKKPGAAIFIIEPASIVIQRNAEPIFLFKYAF